MNKLVCSALAATVVGATGFAGTGNDSWASLDKELETLSATMSAQSGGPQLSGWGIVSYDWSDDLDIEGFTLRSARLNAQGSVGEYGYKLSYDFGQENTLGDFVGQVRDAYLTWNMGDVVAGRLGNFKPPTLSSFLIERNRLLFLDRTLIATRFQSFGTSGRDLGVQFSGDFETVGWWIAVHNGSDGLGDEYLLTGRVAVDLLGEGVGNVEGAYGADDAMALTVAAFYQEDTIFDDGRVIGAEARLTAGPFSAAAEVIDLDDQVGDGTPWDVTLSYLFTEQYEAALRWEDLDDNFDTTRVSVGVNRYVMGHDVKWTLQWATLDSDDASIETDTVSLGLAVSF